MGLLEDADDLTVELLWMGLVLLWKSSLAPSTMGGSREKLTMHNPEGSFTRTPSCWHPDFGLPSSRTVRSKVLLIMSHCSHTFLETNSLRRTMRIVECSLLHWRAQGRESPLSQGPRPFTKTLWKPYIPSVYVLKPTSPSSLKLVWTKEKEDTIKVNPWFVCLKPR